jgi:hypothetical protein
MSDLPVKQHVENEGEIMNLYETGKDALALCILFAAGIAWYVGVA